MKYFTPKWWAMEVERPDEVVADYERYVDSIRSRLPPGLRSLHDEISLHDSKIRRFAVDLPGQTVDITLHGFADPWSPEGQAGRRFDLRYEGVTTLESTNEGEWVSEAFDNSDLGYCEIEILPDGLWEHRMLFASGIELAIRFRDLRLHYEPLPQTATSACSGRNPAVLLRCNLNLSGDWRPPLMQNARQHNMGTRVSKIALVVYAILFLLSRFLLSVPGDYWPWYAAMVPFAIVPVIVGRRWYRIAGAAALVLAAILIRSDIEAGKHFRERRDHSNTQSAPASGGQAASGNTTITILCHAGRLGRAVPEPKRYG